MDMVVRLRRAWDAQPKTQFDLRLFWARRVLRRQHQVVISGHSWHRPNTSTTSQNPKNLLFSEIEEETAKGWMNLKGNWVFGEDEEEYNKRLGGNVDGNERVCRKEREKEERALGSVGPHVWSGLCGSSIDVLL